MSEFEKAMILLQVQQAEYLQLIAWNVQHNEKTKAQIEKLTFLTSKALMEHCPKVAIFVASVIK